MMNISCIILGAGQGTRMQSNLPKPLHKIANISILELITKKIQQFTPDKIVFVLNNEILNLYKPTYQNSEIVIQDEQLGTGHAVACGLSVLTEGPIIILYGDTPLIKESDIQNIIDKFHHDQLDIINVCFKTKNTKQYGRLKLAADNRIVKIVEHKDLYDDLVSDYCNSGILMSSYDLLVKFINQMNKNKHGEFFLTDIFEYAFLNGFKSGFIEIEESSAHGINTKHDLVTAEQIIQDEIRNKMLNKGVILRDFNTIFFSYDTEIEADVVIEPQVIFGNGVKIKKNCTIKSFSYLEDCTIDEYTTIGPFARIRGTTTIGKNCKIGNFVEVKQATVENHVKSAHLSYLGDCSIGDYTNIGAGTIFCNYDGKIKHHTIIGKKTKIGANSSIISPRVIGNNVTIGAGTVVTDDIPDDSLTIARSKQKNIKKNDSK